MLLSSANGKGDINLSMKDRLLLATAPPPYLSGQMTYALRDALGVRFLPNLEEGDQMDFVERIAKGMHMALSEGLDYFYGLSSILVRIGEQFEESTSSSKPSTNMLKLGSIWRLLKAAAIAKFQHRKILPRDIWNIKGIMTGGSDSSVYSKKIEYYWGKKPLEAYGSTEGSTMASQAWNYKGMYFLPDNAFIEFIPYAEHLKNVKNPDYKPPTVLYDELTPGIYELVFTNFHGGVFTRYRIGDLFEVTEIGDAETGIKLPQVQFYSSANQVLDLAGLVRITEKDIWHALERAEIKYTEWTARKEFIGTDPVLHLYIEPKSSTEIDITKTQTIISQQLDEANPEYKDFRTITGRNPLKISVLPHGSFNAYMEYKKNLGADLAHIKPPHMQANDKIIRRLLHPDA